MFSSRNIVACSQCTSSSIRSIAYSTALADTLVITSRCPFILNISFVGAVAVADREAAWFFVSFTASSLVGETVTTAASAPLPLRAIASSNGLWDSTVLSVLPRPPPAILSSITGNEVELFVTQHSAVEPRFLVSSWVLVMLFWYTASTTIGSILSRNSYLVSTFSSIDAPYVLAPGR